MDRYQIDEDGSNAMRDLPPQDILADIAAGLDDIRHGRSVEGHVVLAQLDAMIAALIEKQAGLNQNGEISRDGSAAGR